ncbi:MAG: DNA repair protein RecO [Flavobacteriaceae bacterium]|jgi:DNA repair protein RecO (recombination protein O)|nr:DNA repair protein RecO [Flavobacteriaceae bacterium]
MLVKSEAFVLSAIQYGDSGKIIKLYTESSGPKSFIVKSVYSKRNKQNALFIPLNQLDIVFEEKPKMNLLYFKEITQSFHYQSIYTNPTKTTISLFLSEILNSVLKEEEANSALFRFIRNSLENFDQKESVYADFHLWFLINLSRFLGFYPNLKKGTQYFDLINGISTHEFPSEYFIEKSDLKLFEDLISLDFFHQTENLFNQAQRNSLLSVLILYFELHISDFRRPKSLDVLNQVFE